MARKAQITIYIILGLLLLLSVVLVSYVSQKKETRPVEAEIKIPEEARPVHEFITSCLAQTAKEAVIKLGMQGGYLDIPREILRTPTAYLSLDPENNFKLPYWYYDGIDRTIPLTEIQNQISKYVFEKSSNCEQFEKFDPATVEVLDKLKPETIITEEDVVIKIKWPMHVTLADKTTKIEDYAIRLPVRLKQMWQLADNVMKKENSISFFENRTIDFMSADDNIPTDGLEFNCGPKKWYVPEIKKEMQNILHYNIPYVRVENTNYIPFTEKRSSYQALAKARTGMMQKLEKGISLDQQTPPSNIPDDAYEYFKMTLNTDNAPTDLKASFSYQPEWGLMLAAQPNDGQVLRSNLGKGVRKYLPFICINQWHFTYDIIYPVKLTIKDESAFLNKGYIFQIAFPIIINTNAPERVFFGIQKFPQTQYESDFCETQNDNLVDIRAKGFVEDIPIATELPDANITYRCFNQYCDLGKTEADEGYYRLRTAMPQGCNNPIITAAKDGYLPTESVVVGDKLELMLTKLKTMNVTVAVHPYNLGEQQYMEQTKMLANQKVSLHILLKNTTFDQYKEYPRDTETQIVDGKASYDIDALLTSNDLLIGGYIAEAVNFTYADIADKDTIVLHVAEIRPHPTSTKQQGEMTQFLYSNEQYQKELKPTFR